jgi:hypothetical protein
MIALNGKLYALGNNTTSEGFILEIEPANGSIREVIKGRSNVFQGQGSINVSGLTTDGNSLFTTQSGQLIHVALDGTATAIAGTGATIDFRQPYDPGKPQTADEVQLVSLRRTMTAGSNVFLAYRDKAVYFCATGTTPYIERLVIE